MIAAGLREIASGRDAELDAQMLEEDRHEIGDHDDAEQRVTKLRAARQVGRPIARVHVADRDEKTWAGEAAILRQKEAVVGTTMLRCDSGSETRPPLRRQPPDSTASSIPSDIIQLAGSTSRSARLKM